MRKVLTGNLLTMRSKSARLAMWSSADSEKKEGLAGAGAREQARGRGRAALILGGGERSPSSTSHLLRRKMLLPQSGISMTTSTTTHLREIVDKKRC